MKKMLLIAACLLTTYFANAQFTTAGTAIGTGGTYTLTPKPTVGCGVYKAGAIWSNGSSLPQFVDFTHCFTINFQAMFDLEPGGEGADGMCAVFGNDILPSLTAYNRTNAFLGYYDLITSTCTPYAVNPEFQHSLAVEYDIFDNSYNACTGDPAGVDHIQISRDAKFNSLSGAPVQLLPTSGATNAKDGIFHDYMIDWNCTSYTLSVYVDAVFRTSYTFTPSTIFPTPTAVQWGFTGGSGDQCTNHVLTSITMTVPTCTCCIPPVVGAISGPISVCEGGTITLTDPTPGGSWSTLSTLGTVGATTGDVTAYTGTPGGTMTISYTVGTGPCVTIVTYNVLVVVPPVVGLISGPPVICEGDVVTYTDPTIGGSWSASPSTLGVIGASSGILTAYTGTGGGTMIISYTVTNPPCTTIVTFSVLVMPIPVVAPITGPTFACEGSTITLACTTTGGVWSTPAPTSLATLSSTGDITPTAGTPGGTMIVSYTVGTLPCTTTVTYSVLIIPEPTGCVTSSVLYTASGTWVDYIFTFTCSSPTATMYYQAIDCAGNPLSGPGCLFSIPAGSTYPYVVTLSTLSASCSGICGVCIVGFCDGVGPSMCCWGITSTSSTGPAVTPCCAKLNHLKPGNADNGIYTTDRIGKLSVIPSPNNGIFTLSGEVPDNNIGTANVEVRDILGNIVFSGDVAIEKGNINKTITIGTNVANGLYILKVKNETVNQQIIFSLRR